jgi:hypothetical protein
MTRGPISQPWYSILYPFSSKFRGRRVSVLYEHCSNYDVSHPHRQSSFISPLKVYILTTPLPAECRR